MNRWGNFLQGIESGLDKILAEDGTENQQAHTQIRLNNAQNIDQTEISRRNLTRRKPDRLQERLAKAVDNSSSTSPQSRATPRTSVDSDTKRGTAQKNGQGLNIAEDVHGPNGGGGRDKSPEKGTTRASDTSSVSADQSTELAENAEETSLSTSDLNGDLVAQQEANSVDELNESYLLERIEVLQAKLEVFIKDAAAKARAEQEQINEDSHAWITARQEEKIANLMAEGQSLSQKELKHLGTIRRLHFRLGETESILSRERKFTIDAQQDIRTLKVKIQSLEDAQNTGNSSDDRITRLELDLNQAREQINNYTTEITSLRQELEKAKSNDLKESFNNLRLKSDADQRVISDLKDKLDSANIERDLMSGRHKSQLEELGDRAEQDKSRLKLREAEWQGEIKALESRLEAMRSRNEETIGNPTDAQAKQLRQIEALQRQYSISKENWNGIEASMNARISSLEKERDGLLRKETEYRKKARDAVISLRQKDEELERANEVFLVSEENLHTEQTSVKDLQSALTKARLEHKQLLEQLHIAQETAATRDEPAIDFGSSSFTSVNSYVDGPILSPAQKQLQQAKLDAEDSKTANGKRVSPIWSHNQERPSPPRKTSPILPHNSPYASQTYQQHQPIISATRSPSIGAFRDSHSLSNEGDGGRNEELPTPATPGRNFGDVLTASASIPAAGPSVQLVERMSSAVRRLESEKAAARDELERMASERDEARNQIVSLLEEVEAKRNLERKVSELEDHAKEDARRYQTTLELLGEKSETVEELRADIADMKQIYRETLEKSMESS